MTTTPAILCPSTQLGASVATLYASQANGTAIVKRAVFTNTDTVTHKITVYRVPSGGTPGASNILINALAVSAGQAYVSPELSSMVLIGGDSIQAFADTASKVNAVISGFTQ